MNAKNPIDESIQATSLSIGEIGFLRELAKTKNVYDIETHPEVTRIRLKYGFTEEVGLLLCRELGLSSKISPGTTFPPITKRTEEQWRFIDECRDWITAHQTCPRCLSRSGQRKRIFWNKNAAMIFNAGRFEKARNIQAEYICPHGYGWHLRTEHK
jgi:hypothetical protein